MYQSNFPERTGQAGVAANAPVGHAELPADRIIRRLAELGYDPRPVGHRKWESRCPGHKGTRRNLSITETSDGTVLLRCHHVDDAGHNCPNAAILAVLGFELRDLFLPKLGPRRGPGKAKAGVTARPAGKDKPARKPALFDSPADAAEFLARKLGGKTGHWVYRDAGGAAVLVVYRFDTAKGKQYRPVSLDRESGRWRVGDPEGPLPLYRREEIDGADTVFFQEGEKCSDLVRGLGLVATTTAHGAGSAHKSDLSPLAGKTVVIVPDVGPAGEGYARAVADLLSKLSPPAQVKVLRLPGLTDDGDDIEQWAQARPGRTADELRAELLALAAAAPAVEPRHELRVISAEADKGSNDEVKPNEAPDDPHRLARLFRDARCTHPDGLTLRYWQGEWHEWHDGSYRPVMTEDIRARVTRDTKTEFDRVNVAELVQWGSDRDDSKGTIDDGFGKKGKPKARKVTGSLISNVALALSSYTLLPPHTAQPAWLTDSPPFPAEDVLPTRNSLVYLPGLVSGSVDAIRKPTPLFFAPYSLGYDFDAAASMPSYWLSFLGQLWPDDPESVAALQEWMGYLLTPDTSHQKIMMMIGPKRSGKGTIARIIRAMIGAENVANPTLAGLATNFGVAPLIGKPAAIITDARLSGRTDIAQVVERLLAISGEDSQTVDRKHQSAWNGKLSTRFMLISNELPRLSDTSGALAGRMVLLRLTQSFYGKEDRSLTAKLMGELPGILLWSIEGWRRLRERGYFAQPASGRAMAEKLEELASPVGTFLKERCREAPDAEVGCPELYDAWREWCREHGKDFTGDAMAFGRDLHAVLPHLETPNRRIPGGKRQRFYKGVALVNDFAG